MTIAELASWGSLIELDNSDELSFHRMAAKCK